MDFIYEQYRISLCDESGNPIAEVLFPGINENTVSITNTFVADSLRGQGIAGRLMEALVNKLRIEKKKASPVCSYAVKWFEKHPECQDVLMS